MPKAAFRGHLGRDLPVIAAICLFALPAWAGEPGQILGDPAAVSVPDLSRSGDPEVVANGWKYFFFRRDGATFAEAHADIADCYRFLAPASWSNFSMPRFVAWSQPAASTTPSRDNYYVDPLRTAVYSAFSLLFEGTLARRDRQGKMRRCMETRGYTRYSVAEEVWENVIALPPHEAIAIQAKIASGPDFGGKVPEK